ncbi:MAG: hypothetical protein QW815_00325 [Nitrososphaerota archaeon]
MKVVDKVSEREIPIGDINLSWKVVVRILVREIPTTGNSTELKLANKISETEIWGVKLTVNIKVVLKTLVNPTPTGTEDVNETLKQFPKFIVGTELNEAVRIEAVRIVVIPSVADKE